MRIKQFTLLPFVMSFCLLNMSLFAQTKIIAHRGYWDCKGSAQNSIASLQKAQEIGVYGSEFDVLLTSDNVPVVNHDNKVQGMEIERTPYRKLKTVKLKNGENLPSLKAYLQQGKKYPNTKLILEIKPCSSKEKEDKAIEIITTIVSKMGMDNQVEYISFSLNICQQLVALKPLVQVAYLNGDKSPEELKELNIRGLDYHYNVWQNHPEWLNTATQLGLSTNVWTVNDAGLMREMINNKVNFITTDNPLLLKSLLEQKN